MSQFLDWFHSDADCARYLARLRWPNGFSCPKCEKQTKAWLTKRYLYMCSECGRQTSLIAGTIFEKTRLPLLTWFRAAWMVSSSKSGVSAKELQRELGIGYHVAWLMLQKLRLAMKRPARDRDKLSGDIEVDESYLGGPSPGGKRGRGAEGKVIVAIAVQRKGLGTKSKRWKLGRTRIQVLPDVKAKTLLDFVEDTCEQGSTVANRLADLRLGAVRAKGRLPRQRHARRVLRRRGKRHGLQTEHGVPWAEGKEGWHKAL